MAHAAWAMLAGALLVLKFSQTKQDDVADTNPHAFSQLAADVAEAVNAVEAKSFQPAIAQHARDLGVLCAR